jgi:anti-sigma B factor antagonist
VVWLDGTAVLTLPVEIDISNADQVRQDLLSVLNRGPAILIVDMGGTTFCDSAGVNAIVRAYRRAAANNAEIRLVAREPGVLRILAITGVDHLIAVYPTVAASLAEAGTPGDDTSGRDDEQHGDPGGPVHPDPDDCAAQPR